MSILLDTNILTRLAQHTHPMHAAARDAVAALQAGGETLHLVPQNLYEFWVVATRPVAVNGLGFTVAQADAELARLETLFPVLPETVRGRSQCPRKERSRRTPRRGHDYSGLDPSLDLQWHRLQPLSEYHDS